VQGDIDYIKRYEPLWGGWYVEKLIGEGSFGQVFKIVKEEWGFRYEAALKVIRVPTKGQYREASAVMATNDDSLMDYFEDSVKNIVNEIRVMYTLKGNSNIVGYEDHMVIKRDDPPGWDILLRMEYLKTLHSFISETLLTRKDVIKLGIDICSAIETCSQRGIIHRDIKDENIFVSKYGEFKLGDFGISKELSKSGRAASMKGTPLFMAPEVFRGEKYDVRADLYSLGIVLYRLLNCGRIPLVPPYPEVIKYKDSEEALERRISGEELNSPIEAGDKLGAVILKACRHNSSERYSNASEMRQELERVLDSLGTEEKNQCLTLPGYKKRNEKQRDAEFDKTEVYPEFVPEEQKKSPMDLDDIFFEDDIFEDDFFEDILEQVNGDDAFDGSQQRDIKVSRSSRGNSQGNIINGGLVSSQGLWDYYSITNKLCKVKIDGSFEQVLANISAWYINVLGDWVYFSNSGDDDSIYRISIDGAYVEKLNSDKAWDITVKDDWIFYSNESDGYGIYKIKTDGSCRTKISSDKSYCLNVTKDWIYYVNKNDKGSIYKIKLDGTERVKLIDNDCNYINAEDGCIYYANNSDGGRIYKMTLDGNVVRINEDTSSNINVYGEFIYYSNKNDGGKLYRINKDGSNKTLLCTNSCDFINITENWIYYVNKEDGGNLYKIKFDGSNKVKLSGNTDEDGEWFYL
jgi:serine/threonine protein kinase